MAGNSVERVVSRGGWVDVQGELSPSQIHQRDCRKTLSWGEGGFCFKSPLSLVLIEWRLSILICISGCNLFLSFDPCCVSWNFSAKTSSE